MSGDGNVVNLRRVLEAAGVTSEKVLDAVDNFDALAADAFIDRLCDISGGAAAVVEEHREYFGASLPHSLMSEVARWFASAAEQPDKSAEVSAVAALVEAAELGGEPSVRNMVRVSFLEDLWEPGFEASAAYAELLPASRAWLLARDEWRPPPGAV